MELLLSFLSLMFTGAAVFLIKAGVTKSDAYAVNAVVNTILLAGFAGTAFAAGKFPEVSEMSTATWLCTALSGIVLGISWTLYFVGLKSGDMGIFLGIQSLSIVFSTILCRVFLKEKIGAFMLLGTFVILAGISIMIRYEKKKKETSKGMNRKGSGNAKESIKGMACSLLSAFASSIAYVIVKGDKSEIDTNVTSAFRYIIVTAMLWAIVAIKGKTGEIFRIKSKEWKYVLSGGILSSAGHILIYKALFIGRAAAVLTLYRMGMVVSVILSKIFFHEKMEAGEWLGFFVLAAGVAVYALK